MAIPIIGQSSAEDTTTALPFPDVDLPPPSSAPAATSVLDTDRLGALLAHEHPYMRGYAARRIGQLEDPALIERLLPLIDDASDSVARAVLDILHDTKHEPATDAVATRFAKADGPVAAQAAITLGEIAPDRLVEAMRDRPRLDDHAYALATMSIARSETESGRAFLEKAMNRSAALEPPRRVALYTAALLSGSKHLAQRVVGLAISDSRQSDDTPKQSPARVALSAAAGLPPAMSGSDAGAGLLAGLSREPSAGLEEALQKKIDEAVRAQAPVDVLDAVTPLLDAPIPERASKLMKSAGRRCQALLAVLSERSDVLRGLEVEASALFAAAAIDAASVVSAATRRADDSPAIIAMSRALECEPSELADAGVDDLVARFEPLSPRGIRPVLSILSSEPVNEIACLDRLCEALLKAGHGGALLESSAEAKVEALGSAVLRVMGKAPALAEPLIIEALEERPLNPQLSAQALRAAGLVATERLGLAIGKRFLELREVARFPLAGAVLRIGDGRLAPMVEARAFRDEPEEVAWVILSVLAGDPIEGKLQEAADRLVHRDEYEEEGIRVPLKCGACGETLTYSFPRIYVDPSATERHGDPAFVGDTSCKACAVEDRLEPTETAIQIMTESMVSFLIEAEGGDPGRNPRVVPKRTRYGGTQMSVAEAVRRADAAVAESPDSIRARLRRARVRLILRRKSAIEDAKAAVAQDPNSPEALYVLAGAKAQAESVDAAVEDLAAAHKLVRGEPRLYEETAEAVQAEVEASLLQLEAFGADIPADIDLSGARAAIESQMEAMQQERARAEDAAQHPSPGPSAPSADAMKGAKRNDPCPCGSGKKFKRCHGA